MDSLYNTYIQTYFSILNEEFNSNYITNNSYLIFEAMGNDIEGMYYMQTITQFRDVIKNLYNNLKFDSYTVSSLPLINGKDWLSGQITFNVCTKMHGIINYMYRTDSKTNSKSKILKLYEAQHGYSIQYKNNFDLSWPSKQQTSISGKNTSAYGVTMDTPNNQDTFFNDTIYYNHSYTTISSLSMNFINDLNTFLTTLQSNTTTNYKNIINEALNWLINNVFIIKKTSTSKRTYGFPTQLNVGDTCKIKLIYQKKNTTIGIDINRNTYNNFLCEISNIYPYNIEKENYDKYFVYDTNDYIIAQININVDNRIKKLDYLIKKKIKTNILLNSIFDYNAFTKEQIIDHYDLAKSVYIYLNNKIKNDKNDKIDENIKTAFELYQLQINELNKIDLKN